MAGPRSFPVYTAECFKMFQANLDDNLRALMQDLKKGSFEPFPLRRVFVPKNETEFRPLGIPAVRDRVAQEVVRRLLNPLFERLFHDSSFGFRQGRNCHMAIKRALLLHRAGLRVVLDADIKSFFDNLSHSVIMKAVEMRGLGRDIDAALRWAQPRILLVGSYGRA
jgi:RNA-directed DNA polymerase